MPRFGNSCCLGFALACALPAAARADTISISNHSFETPVVAPDNFIVLTPVPGWITEGTIDAGWRSVGVVNPTTGPLYLDPVPDGSNIGFVFLGPTFSNLPSGLRQTLTNFLEPRMIYTLRVEVGNMFPATNPPHNQFDFAGFPGYRVELLAGTNIVALDNNTLLPGEGRFLTSTVMLATASSHTNIGQAMGIRLLNLDSAAGIEVNFDNVRLDASARPDPVVGIAFATGGAVRIDFTEILSESGDLATWAPLDPQPTSPYEPSPTGSMKFYRGTD